MRNLTIMRGLHWLFFIPFFLWSCQDKMDEHYEVPEWIKGSAWELLSDESMGGKYSMFLEAAERAGYQSIMQGRGLMTVMAPDNDAFTTYLKEHGYSAVKDIPVADLKELVGFHLLYYAYNKSGLENFRPEGEGAYDEGAEILDPGMYYKFRTRSNAAPTKEVEPQTGKTVTVYHLERFVPVFSHYFFSSKKIDAKKNYEAFYPNSTWTGDDGFNVSEATVNEYGLIAKNGYVYTINKVLEPLGSLYDELKNNPDYSDFLAIYDKFSVYTADDELTTKYGEALGVDTLYLHSHRDPLAPIAMEWYKYDYRRLDTLAYRAYSLFAPNNKALKEFFGSYWKNSGYDDFESLDPLIQTLFLNEYVYSGSVAFPEEIESGKVTTASGTKYSFDPFASDVVRKMCVNGSFYGLNKIQTPILFNSVSGPAFHEKRFIDFLYAMNTSELLSSFGSENEKYTLLIPENYTFENEGIYLNVYPEGNKLERKEDDVWESVGSDELQRIIRAHTVMGEEVTLQTTGTQIVPIQSSFCYWFVKDGKITCSTQYNGILEPGNTSYDPFVEFEEVTNNGKAWANGKTYTYKAGSEAGLFEAETEDGTGSSMQEKLATCQDARYPYYCFAQLLREAGMISGKTIAGLSGRSVAFIPTNETLRKALAANEIPEAAKLTIYDDYAVELLDSSKPLTDAEKIALKKYLSNYFVVATSIASACYPGSKMASGDYTNYDGKAVVYTDGGTSLSIKLKDGMNEVKVSDKYDLFPFCYGDGCFHFIESLLK